MHLRAFDCSNLIGRARFGQQRVLTESDIKRGVKGCRISLKVQPLYIGTPLGAFVDQRRGRTRVILVQSTLRDRVGNVGVSAPTADRQTQAAPVLESGIAT